MRVYSLQSSYWVKSKRPWERPRVLKTWTWLHEPIAQTSFEVELFDCEQDGNGRRIRCQVSEKLLINWSYRLRTISLFQMQGSRMLNPKANFHIVSCSIKPEKSRNIIPMSYIFCRCMVRTNHVSRPFWRSQGKILKVLLTKSCLQLLEKSDSVKESVKYTDMVTQRYIKEMANLKIQLQCTFRTAKQPVSPLAHKFIFLYYAFISDIKNIIYQILIWIFWKINMHII